MIIYRAPGQEIIKQACHLHLEGIISKRRGHRTGLAAASIGSRSSASKREEFVIGGFTKPSGNRSHFGALLLGYYGHSDKLIYAGRVGTGFNARAWPHCTRS